MALPDPKGDLVLILKRCDPCIDQMDYMYQLVPEYTVFLNQSLSIHQEISTFLFLVWFLGFFFFRGFCLSKVQNSVTRRCIKFQAG